MNIIEYTVIESRFLTTLLGRYNAGTTVLYKIVKLCYVSRLVLIKNKYRLKIIF